MADHLINAIIVAIDRVSIKLNAIPPEQYKAVVLGIVNSLKKLFLTAAK
ncbi:MAG: hypothetical protein WCE81_01990 [Halobacteriota archaeon]